MTRIKAAWDYIQSLLDIDGDVIMLFFTAAAIFRLTYAAFGHPAVTAAEAALYASAVTAFAYSNKGPKI